MSIETYNYPKPTAPFPYAMKTTAIMEHSRGIAWTADLLLDGVKVGIVEQDGNGGCDRVDFREYADRRAWLDTVALAFAGDEESATFYLLCKEEEG